MKVSTVQAFRSLVDRIHPQIALSPKESQRLLNALTTSFRQQLDQMHPQPQTRAVGQTKSEPIGPALDSNRTHRPSLTDNYLASVLTNPLLATTASNGGSSSGSNFTAEIQNKRHNPVKVFEQYVARGLATMEIAALCLETFRNSLAGLSAVQAQEQIKKMDAGARVLRWLWSTTNQPTELSAQGQRLFANLSYFLVAEGREDAVWDTMATMTEPIKITRPGRKAVSVDPRALLLRSVVAAHLTRSDAASAIRSFLRVADSPAFSACSSTTRHSIQRPAGVYISKRLTDEQRSSTSGSTYAELFDRFVNSCPTWEKSHATLASYRSAQLMLHHPVERSASPALEYIRSVNKNPATWALEFSTSRKKASRLAFFFTTVEVLQGQNLHDDAIWVMDFMRRNMSEELVDTSSLPSVEPSPELGVTTRKDQNVSLDALDWKAPVPC